MDILGNFEGFTRSRTLPSAKNLKALSVSPNVPNRHTPASVKSLKILSIPHYFQDIPTPSNFLRVLRCCQLFKCLKQPQTLHNTNNVRTLFVFRISFEGLWPKFSSSLNSCILILPFGCLLRGGVDFTYVLARACPSQHHFATPWEKIGVTTGLDTSISPIYRWSQGWASPVFIVQKEPWMAANVMILIHFIPVYFIWIRSF